MISGWRSTGIRWRCCRATRNEEAGHGKRDAGDRTRETGRGIRDYSTGHRTPDTGHRTPDTGRFPATTYCPYLSRVNTFAHPDFRAAVFAAAPDARFVPAPADGVLP